MPLTMGGTSGESNIANLWIIANFVRSTYNRDQVMNVLRTVPGHNDVINVHELKPIVRGLKIRSLLTMMEFRPKPISLHLCDC